MESLIRKIQEIEREAQTLKKQEDKGWQQGIHSPPLSSPLQREWQDGRPSPTRSSADRNRKAASMPFAAHSTEVFEGDGDGDWIAAFRHEAGPWKGDPLVVLSLFDGIGGIWAALSRLGIPFIGYSSEVSAPAVQVVKTRYPQVRHVGDVRKLESAAITEEVDLVVGGFPCQDLSCMGKKEGLHGRRSKLFFELLRVLQEFKPKWFLVENVASMSWVDRDEISKHLEMLPFELDSIELTPSRRRRLYWTNIPHPPRLPHLRDHPSTSVQSCLQDAIALESKTGVIMSNNSHNGNNVQLEQVMQVGTKTLRYVNHMEVEMLMGYPANYTHVQIKGADNYLNALITNRPEVVKNFQTPKKHPGRTHRDQASTQLRSQPLPGNRKEKLKTSIRWMLLGNSYSVPVIAYLISPLLKSNIRESSEPVCILGPVKEDECSAMDPGELWALFNQHERPNWYARILKRSGDRFSPFDDPGSKRNVTKQPLRIEMQYLEMTLPYLEDEADEWNPNRGAGLLEVRKEVDIQDSWLAFSHRVTTYLKVQDKIFIYPGHEEVWAVNCPQTWSRYFVYVVDSTILINSLEAAKPGREGFYARCRLLQKTSDRDTYRKMDELLEFTDLSLFCFRAPYHFKHEAGLLKVEVGSKGRKVLRIDNEIRRHNSRKRRRSNETSDDEEDEDEPDEEEGDMEVEEGRENMDNEVEEGYRLALVTFDGGNGGANEDDDEGSAFSPT